MSRTTFGPWPVSLLLGIENQDSAARRAELVLDGDGRAVTWRSWIRCARGRWHPGRWDLRTSRAELHARVFDRRGGA